MADYTDGVDFAGLKEPIFQPVRVDSVTGQVIAAPTPPWYVSALALSQPLHFDDYGDVTLKVIWALLDLTTIAVLVSGLVLTVSKGRKGPRCSRIHIARSLVITRETPYATRDGDVAEW